MSSFVFCKGKRPFRKVRKTSEAKSPEVRRRRVQYVMMVSFLDFVHYHMIRMPVGLLFQECWLVSWWWTSGWLLPPSSDKQNISPAWILIEWVKHHSLLSSAFTFEYEIHSLCFNTWRSPVEAHFSLLSIRISSLAVDSAVEILHILCLLR